MIVEVIYVDFLLGLDAVVGGEDGRRRTCVVHQTDREKRASRNLRSEMNPVKITQRVVDRVNMIAVSLEVSADFAVRHAVDDRRGARVMAKERHIRHTKLDLLPGKRRRDGDPPALRTAHDRNAFGIHMRMLGNGGNRPDGVSEHATVVIGIERRNATRHETGILRTRRSIIRRIARSPIRPLPPRIHDKMRKARGRRHDVIHRKTPPSAIPQVRDDRRKRLVIARGLNEPPLDRLAHESFERHVIHVDEMVELFGKLHEVRRDRSGLLRFRQGAFPEGIEILRRLLQWVVSLELLKRKIE